MSVDNVTEEQLKDAFYAGYDSYGGIGGGGPGLDANPYSTSDSEILLWQAFKDGYYAAAWDD